MSHARLHRPVAAHGVRREWTAKQAMAAQKRFQSRGGRLADPTGPVSQWSALHHVEKCERAFQAGDKGAILEAIAVCLRTHLVSPEWLIRAYLGAYRSVIQHKVRSWDAAFGTAHRKGTHLAAARILREKSPEVWLEVERRRDNGAPADDELFEAVGVQLHMGKTFVKKCYAAFGGSPAARRKKNKK